ncbi:MAG: type II secretion system protein GspM [Wenzhouxiangella sp.]
MSAYWNNLNLRQQRLLLVAALIVVVLALYVWAWEPMAETRVTQREQVAQQQALLDWLTALTPVATQMRRETAPNADLGGRSLLGLADETARAAGLAGSLSRIEPDGNAQVRVWLEDANFVATMGWLQQLSIQHPIEVSQLSVDRARQAGQVNVRVTLSTDA